MTIPLALFCVGYRCQYSSAGFICVKMVVSILGSVIVTEEHYIYCYTRYFEYRIYFRCQIILFIFSDEFICLNKSGLRQKIWEYIVIAIWQFID